MSKSKVEISSEIKEFSVEDAKKILADQGKNRPLKMAKVRKIAEDISEKSWHLNGESIVFDTKGKLLDGQHRLAGLVMAGEKYGFTGTIRSLVASGVDRKLFATFDQGEKRSLADVVAIDDYENPKELAVAVRLLKIRLAGGKVSGTGRMDHSDALATLSEHPELVDWVKTVVAMNTDGDNASALKAASLMSPGYLAVLCYLAAMDYGAAEVQQFLADLLNQEHTEKGSGAFRLRNLLLANRGKDTKLTRDAIVAHAVKAMIAYLSNEAVTKLSIKSKEYPTFPSEYTGGDVEEEASDDAE